MEKDLKSILDSNTSIEGRSGSFIEFIGSFLVLIILTYIVQKLYEQKGQTLGDKKYFASFFIIWSVSIFLIISVIKSSVVLSLGMVGALSIVRFRNAIKDTEQIMYLLMLIALSISLASNQYLYTLVVFGFILLFIYFRNFKNQQRLHSQFIYVTFDGGNSLEIIIQQLTKNNNQIVSIEKTGDKFELTATFNNYLETEVHETCQWLSKENFSFRINQNFYL
jgi:hypothetical protein